MKKVFKVIVLLAIVATVMIGQSGTAQAEPSESGTTKGDQARELPPLVIGERLDRDVPTAAVQRGWDHAAKQSAAYQAAYAEEFRNCMKGASFIATKAEQRSCVRQAKQAGRQADTGYVGEEGSMPDFGGPIVREL